MTMISKKTFFSVLCAGAATAALAEEIVWDGTRLSKEWTTANGIIHPGSNPKIEGSAISVTGGLEIKGENEDALLRVSGGTMDIHGDFKMHGKNGKRGELLVDGTGTVEHTDSTRLMVYADDGLGFGRLSVTGHGTFRTLPFGDNLGSTPALAAGRGNVEGWSYFDVSDYGQAFLCGKFNQLAENGTGPGAMTISGHGYVGATGLSFATGDNRAARLTLTDQATLVCNLGSDTGGNDTLLGSAGASFSLRMQDDALFCITNKYGSMLTWGNGKGRLDMILSGGKIRNLNDGYVTKWVSSGARDSVVRFDGVDAKLQQLTVGGVQETLDYTNVVEVASGKLDISSDGDGVIIWGKNRNSMFLVSGGEVAMGGKKINVGADGSNAEGYHAVFRQTGGTITNPGGIDLCSGSHCNAEMELLGGVYNGREIRGANYCVTRGGQGWARAYYNGGTIRWDGGDWANLIYTVPENRLGPKGLTVDVAKANLVHVHVAAKFESEGVGTADEVDGLFVKTGPGLLTIQLKDSDNGTDAWRSTELNSTHTYTRIDQGTLMLDKLTEAKFGKNITVKGGAKLSIAGDVSRLTVDTLTLGGGSGEATVTLDAEDLIVINTKDGLDSVGGVLEVPYTDNGEYPIFIAKAGMAEKRLYRVAVKNASADHDYAWTTAQNEAGETVCSLVIGDKGTLKKTIEFNDEGTTVIGTGQVSAITASVDKDFAEELILAAQTAVGVESGKTLTLSGALDTGKTTLTKSGSGKLVVAGVNADFNGTFVANGGTLEVSSAAAFGPSANGVTLKSGTFRYSGENAVRAGKLMMATETAELPVVLDAIGDMTFSAVDDTKGVFVKRGEGAVTLDLGEGTYLIADNNKESSRSEGTVVFNDNGDSPERTGLDGFAITEGALCVLGQGANVTKLLLNNNGVIGTGYLGEKPAVLAVTNACVAFNGKRCTFARNLPQGAPAPEIWLKDALLESGSISIGEKSSAVVSPKLVMDNSVIHSTWTPAISDMDRKLTVQIDAKDSVIGGPEADRGWQIRGLIEADFHGAKSAFASTCANTTEGSSGRILVYDNVAGYLKFREGAHLDLTRGLEIRKATLDIVFDGGVFAILPHEKEEARDQVSTWNKDKTGVGLTTTGAGMEIAICEGSTHSLNFPIKGDGSVTKTGAGTFKLVEGRGVVGEKLLQNTGLTTVAEGTLVLDGSLVAEGAKLAVAAGATLDLNGSTLATPVSGAGTITNGKLADDLTLVYGDEMPIFGEGVLGSKLTVDFTGTTAEFKTPYVVGHYTGAAPVGLKVKAVNTGLEAFRAVTTCENGDIKVTLVKSGLLVLVK